MKVRRLYTFQGRVKGVLDEHRKNAPSRVYTAEQFVQRYEEVMGVNIPEIPAPPPHSEENPQQKEKGWVKRMWERWVSTPVSTSSHPRGWVIEGEEIWEGETIEVSLGYWVVSADGVTVSAQYTNNRWKFSSVVQKIFPPLTVTVDEELVALPMPPWVDAVPMSTAEKYGHEQEWVEFITPILFRSDAEQVFKEFIVSTVTMDAMSKQVAVCY